MSQPSHTCRIPGNDREASDLVDQSINQPLGVSFFFFFSCNDLSCEHLPYQYHKYLVQYVLPPFVSSHLWAVIIICDNPHHRQRRNISFMPNASQEQSHLL